MMNLALILFLLLLQYCTSINCTGQDGLSSKLAARAKVISARDSSLMQDTLIKDSLLTQDSSGVSEYIRPDNITNEPVPSGAYAVIDHHGHICILITLSVEFEILYYTEYGERKRAGVPLPKDAVVSGSCARDGDTPKIIFSWGNFRFAILFSQNEFGNTWFVNDMRLFYNMKDSVFKEARDEGHVSSARMDIEAQHVLKLFASPIDKAYMCSSEQDLDLLDSDGSKIATILLQDVHIQPYVKHGQFGPSVNCPGGKVGRRRINDTVTLAVGSTLACVTIATIGGYALWRYVKVKKFTYGNME